LDGVLIFLGLSWLGQAVEWWEMTFV